MSRLLHSASFTGLSTPMRRKRLGSRSSKFKYAIWQIVRGLAVGKCVENFARGHRTIPVPLPLWVNRYTFTVSEQCLLFLR